LRNNKKINVKGQNFIVQRKGESYKAIPVNGGQSIHFSKRKGACAVPIDPSSPPSAIDFERIINKCDG
jgi:hypothetical protein